MIAAPTKWSRPTIGPTVSVADAFAALCNAALAQIAANALGVARGVDPEYLHQLRVGARRFLSAMRTFRPLLKRKCAKAIAQELRDAMQVFGPARDWDVFLETVERAGASKTFVASATQQREVTTAQARALARSAAFRETQGHVRGWLDKDPWRASAKPTQAILGYASDSLDRAHRRLGKRARDIDWRDRRERHRVRIALKRLRYACDFFADCFPGRPVRPFLARLSELQDTLGELNDLAVAHTLLSEVPVDAKRLQRWLTRREGDLIASLSRDWEAFARRRPYWRHAKASRAARQTPRASASRA